MHCSNVAACHIVNQPLPPLQTLSRIGNIRQAHIVGMSELFAFSDDDDLGGSMKPLGDVVDTDVSSDSDEEGEEVHPSKKARGKMKAGGDMNHDATSDAIEKEMLMRELRRQREQLKTLKESIGASSAGRNSGSASSSSVQFLRALREARRASSSRESGIGDAEDNDRPAGLPVIINEYI